jgi:hypothetical protein
MGIPNNFSPNYNGGRKGGTIGRFGFDKFMQLAKNSYGVGKLNRAVDNCRLAVDYAIRENNQTGAAMAYQLWIKAYMELKKFAEAKKVCCEARSKFGNHPDLIYYEYKVAALAGETGKAVRLGKEFIEMCHSQQPSDKKIFTDTCDILPEVISFLELNKSRLGGSKGNVEMERVND